MGNFAWGRNLIRWARTTERDVQNGLAKLVLAQFPIVCERQI